MGCDIHGVFELKVDETWKCIPSLYDWERHYTLFGFLAGVRNHDIKSVAGPRGFPADFVMCHSTDEDRDDAELNLDPEYYYIQDPILAKSYRKCRKGFIWMGEHSQSWLTLAEMKSVLDIYAPRHEIENLDYFAKEINRLITEYSKSDGSDIRMVFGFDS